MTPAPTPPPHPPAPEGWRSFSQHEGLGTGDYVRFCNMLISDSIFLLDDR